MKKMTHFQNGDFNLYGRTKSECLSKLRVMFQQQVKQSDKTDFVQDSNGNKYRITQYISRHNRVVHGQYEITSTDCNYVYTGENTLWHCLNELGKIASQNAIVEKMTVLPELEYIFE